MVFDVSVAMTWVLYLALLPMTFFCLRRAWRIGVKRDFSEVALKRGARPGQPERWAPHAMAVNGLAGAEAVFVIVGVLGFALRCDTWTAIAGSTIGSKFFLQFAPSRQAHVAVARATAAAAKAAGAAQAGRNGPA